MSDNNASEKQPYQPLGAYLRKIRQKMQESAAEVSGAVEIDVDMLERIERGIELPTEDILMLLISHFGLRDDEAVDVWELAGYDQDERTAGRDHPHEDPRFSKQPVVLLALDTRVVYSNGIEAIADKSGVILNFTQAADPMQGRVPVARVGMSHDQAMQVLSTLERTLLREKYAAPKTLPAPKTKAPRRTKKQQPKKED